MTAALLNADHVRDRRHQLRRQESRQAFLSPSQEAPAPCQPEPPRSTTTTKPTPPPPSPPPPVTKPAPPANATTDSADDDDAQALLAEERVREFMGHRAPTQRNREIFRAVVVDERSQRDVAAEFGISQPRVNQILRLVSSWLSRVVVERDKARPAMEQVQLAENVIRMQYDHLYATALNLLHGRNAPASASGAAGAPTAEPSAERAQSKPHQPRPAFLQAAIRAVSEKARFEGLIGRPVSRAMRESNLRQLPTFGPPTADEATLWGLDDDDPLLAPYKPLSLAFRLEGDEPLTAADVSEAYRKKYARYPERFGDDFDARADYYLTEIDEVFGPYMIGVDQEEDDLDRLNTLHETDLMGARVDREMEALVRRDGAEAWPPERIAQVRRQKLMDSLKRDVSSMTDGDADSLLNCYGYDDATGLFGWEQNFAAWRQSAG